MAPRGTVLALQGKAHALLRMHDGYGAVGALTEAWAAVKPAGA
jgi:hypothetical protein